MDRATEVTEAAEDVRGGWEDDGQVRFNFSIKNKQSNYTSTRCTATAMQSSYPLDKKPVRVCGHGVIQLWTPKVSK